MADVQLANLELRSVGVRDGSAAMAKPVNKSATNQQTIDHTIQSINHTIAHTITTQSINNHTTQEHSQAQRSTTQQHTIIQHNTQTATP